MDYEKKPEVLEWARKHWIEASDVEKKHWEFVFPKLRESDDERTHREILEYFNKYVSDSDTRKKRWIAYLEKQKEKITAEDYESSELFQLKLKTKYANGYQDGLAQKEQKPIIQDVELNDAVYDYVRDHFIAGADFTPEYIKKLMENAFFAGVDYYLLKQESESCEPDTNVEKVIEDVICVYGKTQGEWVGGYDVDTLIVNLRRAFNKKEQKPEEWSEEDEKWMKLAIQSCEMCGNPVTASWLKSLRPSWKPSEEQMYALGAVVKGYEGGGIGERLKELYEQLKKLMKD